MHKNTKLLPYARRELFRRWGMGIGVTDLAREYKVCRQTVYDTIVDARLGIFHNRTSENHRYRNLAWGLKRLADVETKIGARLERKAHRMKRYEKETPGEMVHLDTKRLPLLRGEMVWQPREYLFVAIDDHSRTLFADIFPDKTSYSAEIFLEEAKRFFLFPIRGIYSDNGSEYKGTTGHPVAAMMTREGWKQSFTKVKHPWTNGKAERVIKTLMTEWHPKSRNLHQTREHRRRHLLAYVDWYNQARFHSSIGSTPMERLERYAHTVYNA